MENTALQAHSTRLIDWRWLRVEKRHHARNYCWWAITPFGMIRARWARAGRRLFLEWGRDRRPESFTVALGRRWTLYLTFDRGFRMI